MTPCGENGEVVVIPQQTIGRRLHVHQLLGRRIDAAENAEHELQEDRPFQQSTLAVERNRLDVADVVAFEFEANPLALAEIGKNGFNVPKGILKHDIARRLEKFGLPFVPPFRLSLGHGK